jgi:hypothetical protein
MLVSLTLTLSLSLSLTLCQAHSPLRSDFAAQGLHFVGPWGLGPKITCWGLAFAHVSSLSYGLSWFTLSGQSLHWDSSHKVHAPFVYRAGGGDEGHLLLTCPALERIRHRYGRLFTSRTDTMVHFLWQDNLVSVATPWLSASTVPNVMVFQLNWP